MDSYAYEPGYEKDLYDGWEPDGADWEADQAEARWMALPWIVRAWLTATRRLSWWWRTRAARRERTRAHRQMHPGIALRDCPDPWHGDELPF